MTAVELLPAGVEARGIRVPGLLDHQADVAARPQRFKVYRWGRRAGKDISSLNAMVWGHGPLECPGRPYCPRAGHSAEEPCYRGLIDGLDVAWIAPDYKQANLMWEQEVEPRFRDQDGVHINRVERTVALQGYGTLWVRSSETIDSVRGIGKFLAGVVINEAAHMDLEYVWKNVLRPALMDNKGWAIICSTTNAALDGNQERRTPSYFNVLCQEIMDGKRSEEEWFHSYRLATDNPLIDPREFESLVAEYQPDSIALQEEVFAKLLEARVGLVFSEWRDNLHVLPANFEVPGHWRWSAGLDYGFRSPGWLGLFAQGPDGDVVCSDELYFKGLHAYEAGRQCARKALTAKIPLEYVAVDEAMDAHTGAGAGPTILEEFRNGWDAVYGGAGRGPALIKVAKGAGSRAHRVQVMHRYLSWRADEKGQVPARWQPLLKFHPRCANAIRTIPKLPYDPVQIEDVDTNAEDHAYDGATYFLMSRPQKATAPRERQDENTHPGFDYGSRRRAERYGPKSDKQEPPKGFVPRGPLRRAEDF